MKDNNVAKKLGLSGKTLEEAFKNEVLWGKLCQFHPEQIDRVLGQEMCDIGMEFLGFVSTYEHLSKIIPPDLTVIDLGCAYAPQAYYFKDHKRYIGVDLGSIERFEFENTEIVEKDIRDYIKEWKEKDTSRVFAICNYALSSDTEEVRKTFKNLFVFYPV